MIKSQQGASKKGGWLTVEPMEEDDDPTAHGQQHHAGEGAHRAAVIADKSNDDNRQEEAIAIQDDTCRLQSTPDEEGAVGRLFHRGCSVVFQLLWAFIFFVVVTTLLHAAIERRGKAQKLAVVLSLVDGSTYYPIDSRIISEQKEMSRYYQAEKEPAKALTKTATCALTYSIQLPEGAEHIDPYDHELLATFMVRLCHCEECVIADRSSSFPQKQEANEQHSSSPSSPFLRNPFPHHAQGNGEPTATAIAEGLHIQSESSSSLRTMAEFLKGAHVIIEGDQGRFYSWLTKMQDSYKRASSHDSTAPTYGIPQGSIIRTILTGRTRDGSTWFQFEAHHWDPWERPWESFRHAINYAEYVMIGSQVGPLGVSRATDANPIRLSYFGACENERSATESSVGSVIFHAYDPDDPTGKSLK